MATLADRLNVRCDSVPFRVGWNVQHLPSGFSAQRDGDVVFPSTSTRKVAILMTALKGVNEGRFALGQQVRLDKHVNQDAGGCFQHLSRGITITFQDALVMMIIVSDNTCTSHVAGMVGLENVNALCQSLGMERTSHRQGVPPDDQPRDPDPSTTNATTPNDQALLLDVIVRGAGDPKTAGRLGCSPAQCRLALDIMSWQKFRNRIPSWLPYGTKVANKTGTHEGTQADVGVVFENGSPLYILTLFTSGVPAVMPDGAPGGATADLLMGRLSRDCWDAFAAHK